MAAVTIPMTTWPGGVRLSLLLAVLCAVFAVPLWRLAGLSWSDDRYTHCLIMPAVVAVLVYMERRELRAAARPGRSWSAILTIVLGFSMGLVPTLRPVGTPDGALSLEIAGLIVALTAIFVLELGWANARKVLFPLLLLWLTVPLPSAWLHIAEIELQNASADVAGVLFQRTGLPVFREGVFFTLPGLKIQVAEECSGIRSTTALFISVAIVSYLQLRTVGGRLLMLALAIPVGILKNGLRITTLAWLSVNVSVDYMHGRLHQYGGLPFTAIAVGILLPVLLTIGHVERLALKRRALAPQV